jgi:ABC-type amino acid transport substrate-binding protein
MDVTSNTPALIVENLHKSFGSLEVLKGVSLTANEGDVIALIGSSGSGKSTLLRCINLLEIPDSGTVTLRGERIAMTKDRHGRTKPANHKQVDFTDRYYLTPARFVARKGSNIEISKEGLKGKTVGVQRATVHENFVRDYFGNSITIRSYATQDEANMDLETGRLDLVIADAVVLDEGFLKTDMGKDFEFVGPGYTDERWFGEGIGIALRKEDDTLRKMFNKAIAEIRANGVYKKINDKYFDFDVYGGE